MKYFKPGGVLANVRNEGAYYDNERKVNDKACEILVLWNKQRTSTRTESHMGHSYQVSTWSQGIPRPC